MLQSQFEALAVSIDEDADRIVEQIMEAFNQEIRDE